MRACLSTRVYGTWEQVQHELDSSIRAPEHTTTARTPCDVHPPTPPTHRMGTHPNCPSSLKATGTPLGNWIQAHPSCLGVQVQQRFGSCLPFLFKVRDFHEESWGAWLLHCDTVCFLVGSDC